MRQCRKCKKSFPFRMTINGKQHNLGSRKYCIECSPFGRHNTKKDIDSCSGNSSNLPWAEMSQSRRDSIIASNERRGEQRKIKLIELAGGSCKLCGYNKSTKALSFHHRNRNDKKFCLSVDKLRTRNEEQIMLEFAKCDLLCLNCHAEVEEELYKQKWAARDSNPELQN